MCEARVGVIGKLGSQQFTDRLVQIFDLSLGEGDPDQCTNDALGDGPHVMTIGLIETLPIVFIDQIPTSHDQDAANTAIRPVGHLIFDHCQRGRVDSLVFRCRGARPVRRRHPSVGQ